MSGERPHPGYTSGDAAEGVDAAVKALTKAVHTLRCTPPLAADPDHPPDSTESDLDRAWARFLLATLRTAGWRLAQTSAGAAFIEPATERPAAPRVLDQPCPRCGSPDTTLIYFPDNFGCRSRLSTWKYCMSRTPDGEHFHRECRRCGYHWRTDDVLDAAEVNGG